MKNKIIRNTVAATLVGAFVGANEAKAGDLDIYDILNGIQQGAELVDRLQNPQRYDYYPEENVPAFEEQTTQQEIWECYAQATEYDKNACLQHYGYTLEQPRYQQDARNNNAPWCYQDYYLKNGNRGGTINTCKGEQIPHNWGTDGIIEPRGGRRHQNRDNCRYMGNDRKGRQVFECN